MSTEEEIPVGELEQEIVAFLDKMSDKPGGTRQGPGCNLIHGPGCSLATCVDNIPRATPMGLFHDGMTVWMAGEPGGKIANIMRNPHVSVAVYETIDHRVEQKSLQVFGLAELLNERRHAEEFLKRFRAFGLEEALKGQIEEFVEHGIFPENEADSAFEKLRLMINLIKVTPVKMIMLHMTPGRFPVRKIWEPGRAVVRTDLGRVD